MIIKKLFLSLPILTSSNMGCCAQCGKKQDLVLFHFDKRLSPYNQPFYHLLYFSDPFFGGTNKGYCSAPCYYLGEKNFHGYK